MSQTEVTTDRQESQTGVVDGQQLLARSELFVTFNNILCQQLVERRGEKKRSGGESLSQAHNSGSPTIRDILYSSRDRRRDEDRDEVRGRDRNIQGQDGVPSRLMQLEMVEGNRRVSGGGSPTINSQQSTVNNKQSVVNIEFQHSMINIDQCTHSSSQQSTFYEHLFVEKFLLK